MVRTNRFISAPCLRMQMIRRFGRRMLVLTIRRRLLAAGYWSRRPARCPGPTLEHRQRRSEWGRRHRLWDLRQWRHCIVSDESRFSLYHSDGRVRVRRRQGERLIDACVQPNDGSRGPSVMVWGAIHHVGRSELVVVDGAMNRHRYIQILRNQMLPWATGVFERNFEYVQNNAPTHTARDTAAFLDQQDVEARDWPARSPYMNPIEHVWDQMSVWIRDIDSITLVASVGISVPCTYTLWMSYRWKPSRTKMICLSVIINIESIDGLTSRKVRKVWSIFGHEWGFTTVFTIKFKICQQIIWAGYTQILNFYNLVI